MDEPTAWELLRYELMEWEKELPALSDSERDNLLSMGEALPDLLFEADDQTREELDEVILKWTNGVQWPEMRPVWKIFLRERFEWAFAVISTNERCGIPAPDGFPVSDLLIEGWDSAGASYTHEDFLRKYLPELLRHAARGRCGDVGG